MFHTHTEFLEPRRLMSTAILSYHGDDLASDGQNLTETTLTPSNVNVNSFGKLYTTALDGVAVAQPLYDPGVSITTGTSQGVHNVVYVATESDSLYAIDSATGTVLWKDSFLVPEAALNVSGASVSVSTVLASDVNSSDTPIIGITGTPAIDPSLNAIFLIAKTKQIVNNATTAPHFVQTLYKINLGSGSYTGTVIADTTYNTSSGAYIYNSGPYVFDPHDQGSGVVTATINGVSKDVVYFNALRSFSRVGVTIYNGNVYLGFASHGDNAPYHGWILGYSESTLAATAVFNADPDGGDDGIWGGGGKIAIDSSGNFYVETGNGTFDTTLTGATSTFAGFPQYGDYGDSFLKIAVDPTTSVTNQNINGWGLKVVDYFTPQNQAALSGADQDIGSGSPMVLPATIGSVTLGSTAAPNLLVGSGKDGVIYLMNTANMGQYHSTTDNVVQEVSGGVSGAGSYDTPTLYYDGTHAYILYAGKSSAAQEYQIANGVISSLSSASTMTIGQFGSSIEISGSGTNNGIAWLVDGGANAIRAFNPTNLAQEYYDSNEDASRDALGTANKFETLTIADGQVYAVNTNSLVAYGLVAVATSPPTAPTNLVTSVVSNDAINLSWTDTATNAYGYYVDEEPAGSSTWTQIASLGSTAVSYQAVGLAPGSTYSFKVQAWNSDGNSAFSNVASGTTTNTTVAPNFNSGFGSYVGELTLNGATISGTALELTDGNDSEARSAFTDNAVSVQGFTTSFTFQLTSAQADGFTYTMQNQAPTAVGGGGGDLGYGGTPGITPSVCIKFDIYSNNGEGTDSTGLFVYGDAPEEPTGSYKVEASDDMTSSGVVLTSGDPMTATLSYNGTVLSETVTDNTTKKSFSTTYTINIPSYVGGGYAYVGFTGGTGGESAIQKIQTWNYSAVAVVPYTPANLTVTPASGTELDLAWNEPYSTVSNYDVLELKNGSYQQIAQVPGTMTSDNVTGLLENTTYSFEVIAVNSAGSSAPTSPVSGTTPYPPADVSNLVASNINSSGVTLTWQNNATNATSIRLTRQLESDNSQYVGTLTSTTTTYTDSGLLPGRAYDYEIAAQNLAGPSNGVDVVVETIPAAPAAPTPSVAGTSITLNWAAYGHAVTEYNVYRGTSPGGESATPIATDVPTNSYIDTNLTPGVTYYYTITAVDTGGEGPMSTEVHAAIASATPVVLTGPINYLRLDSDGALDVYTSSTGTGTPTQYIASSVTFTGSAAASSLIVDFSAGDPLPTSGLSVNGGSGGVGIIILGTTGNDSLSVNSSVATFNGVPIYYTSASGITFDGGAGHDTLTQAAGAAPLTFGGTSVNDTLIVNGGLYTFAAPTAGSGIVPLELGTLSIAPGAEAVLANATAHTDRTVLQLNSLCIAGSTGNWLGTLDLGGNDLDLATGGLGQTTNQILLGYRQGAWTGKGIISSLAAANASGLTTLGAIVNNVGGTTPLYGSGTALGLFDGLNPAATDVLVKYTYYGDANLDGKVDASDYSRIDNAFATGGKSGWFNGDFNYDGVIDGSDYTLIDNAFNSQGAALTAEVATPSAQIAVARPGKSSRAASTFVMNSLPFATTALRIFSITPGVASEIFSSDFLADGLPAHQWSTEPLSAILDG
jgi:fibronectin type 3 domain-containing protein